MLKIENLSCSYRCWRVFEDISFSAEYGEFICILGKNGCGKTTLFKSVLNLIKPYAGIISIDGTNISCYTPRSLSKKIAYISQSSKESLNFKVIDIVLMGTTSSLNLFALPKNEQLNTAKKALETLGISQYEDRNFSHLSGGEQQLVLIARAIAQGAKILIMDEPCSNLDYGNQIKVMKEAKKLSNQGYLIIMSTHNPQQAISYADKVMIMGSGKLLGYGSAKNIVTSEILSQIYDVPLTLTENDGRQYIISA